LFGSLQQIELAIRQLLGARKYSVSCRVVWLCTTQCRSLFLVHRVCQGPRRAWPGHCRASGDDGSIQHDGRYHRRE